MDFEEARIIVLYLLAHELLLEELELARDTERDPNYETYEEEAYATLVGERDWIIHLFGFTEDELVVACTNHWEAFVK